MAPNQYGGQSNMADITKTSNKIILTSDRQSTGQYTHKYQGENTNKSSFNLQVLIHGNGETVLTDVIYGKPKQIR